MGDEKMIVYTAVYDNTDAALADLAALEEMHDRDMLGKYDAAVVDKENNKPHIVKRVDQPAFRVVPELLGGGTLPKKELNEAAAELTAGDAGLIVVGEPTLETAFNKSATRAVKTAKRSIDSSADELVAALRT